MCYERVLMYEELEESFKTVAPLEIGPEIHALKGSVGRMGYGE